MDIEKRISDYLVRCAKFEFFLVNSNIELAKIRSISALQTISGIEWNGLAALIEEKHPYGSFNFSQSGFSFLNDNAPQFLTKRQNGSLKWDSDEPHIDSWLKVLTRSYAQLRNNIAHGNKGYLLSQFTQDRTEKFIEAGNKFMDFIAKDVFGNNSWEEPITFK